MIFDNYENRQLDYADCWLKIYRYYSIHYPFYQMDLHSHAEWEIMYVVHGRCRILCVEDGSRDECGDGLGSWPEDGHKGRCKDGFREQRKYGNLVRQAAGREFSTYKEEREVNQESYITVWEKEYELREGEYILLGGGVRHKLTVDREFPCRILNMEGKMDLSAGNWHMKQFAQEDSFRRFMAGRERVVTGNDDGRLYEAMHALIQELKRAADATENLLVELLIGQFMLLLARQKAAAKKKKDGGSVYVRRTADYLAENFDQEIRIADAAANAGISEGYLQRLFKKETGRSIMNKILELRVEKAKLLLETSSLPIIDIAVNVGFNSRQHFAAVFMQLTGCSPMQWRKSGGNMKVSVGFGTGKEKG